MVAWPPWPSPVCASRLAPGGSLRQAAGLVSDEVELYHRTYTTLLRSSGETLLRVLEPSHRSMNSSLHALAATGELDLGAFLYAMRRLPAGIWQAGDRDGPGGARRSSAPASADRGVGRRRGAGAPPPLVRRPPGHDGGAAGLHVGPRRPDPDARRLPGGVEQAPRAAARRRPAGRRRARPAAYAEAYGGAAEDWIRIREAWGTSPRSSTRSPTRRLNLRIRMLGGSQAGYARMTRRWWAPVRRAWTSRASATARSTSSPPTRTRWSTSSPPTARAGRGRDRRLRRGARPRLPARGARALPRGPRRGLVGELPLLRRAAVWEALPEDGPEWERRRRPSTRSASRTSPAAPRCASPRRSSRSTSSTRRGSTRGSARRRRGARAARRRDRQHRVSARPRRLQHPARADRSTDA